MNCIFLILLAFSGFLLLIKGCWYFGRMQVVGRWEKKYAVILNVSIDKIKVPEVYVFIEYYRPTVKYCYKVEGVEYYSNKVSIDEKAWISDDRKTVEHLLENISKQKSCYVNPSKVSQAILIPDVPGKRLQHYYGVLASGVILFLSALIFIFVSC